MSAAPLKSIESDFAVDSSGFSTGQFTRWLDVKYGTKEDRRQWLKLHLTCGVKTNIVTAVQVTDGYAHDYPFFKGLIDRTADSGFQMKEVSADKGYLGASNMLATLQRGDSLNRDIVVLTDWMAGRWVRSGWVEPIDRRNTPNVTKNPGPPFTLKSGSRKSPIR